MIPSHDNASRFTLFESFPTTANGLLPHALEIFFAFANLHLRPLPPLPDLPPPLIGQLVKRGPVHRVIVVKLDVPAVDLHELLRGHNLAHIDVKLHLLAREGVDEGVDELEEAPDDPGHVLHARVAEPFRVVILQNRERLPTLAHGWVLPALAALLEVDQNGEGFLTGGDEVDAALEHEDQILHLPFTPLSVLSMRVEIEAWSAGVVVAEDDLLTRLVLFEYVVGRQALDLKFSAPDQSSFKARHCVGFVPF